MNTNTDFATPVSGSGRGPGLTETVIKARQSAICKSELVEVDVITGQKIFIS